MTEHEKIEQLKVTAPVVVLTKGQRVALYLSRFLGFVAAVALVLSLVAMQKAVNVGNCINSNLGDRNGLAARDTAAQIVFANSLQSVLAAPKADQAHQYQLFLGSLKNLTTTLKSDQSYRSSHPLGKC